MDESKVEEREKEEVVYKNNRPLREGVSKGGVNPRPSSSAPPPPPPQTPAKSEDKDNGKKK